MNNNELNNNDPNKDNLNKDNLNNDQINKDNLNNDLNYEEYLDFLSSKYIDADLSLEEDKILRNITNNNPVFKNTFFNNIDIYQAIKEESKNTEIPFEFLNETENLLVDKLFNKNTVSNSNANADIIGLHNEYEAFNNYNYHLDQIEFLENEGSTNSKSKVKSINSINSVSGKSKNTTTVFNRLTLVAACFLLFFVYNINEFKTTNKINSFADLNFEMRLANENSNANSNAISNLNNSENITQIDKNNQNTKSPIKNINNGKLANGKINNKSVNNYSNNNSNINIENNEISSNIEDLNEVENEIIENGIIETELIKNESDINTNPIAITEQVLIINNSDINGATSNGATSNGATSNSINLTPNNINSPSINIINNSVNNPANNQINNSKINSANNSFVYQSNQIKVNFKLNSSISNDLNNSRFTPQNNATVNHYAQSAAIEIDENNDIGFEFGFSDFNFDDKANLRITTEIPNNTPGSNLKEYKTIIVPVELRKNYTMYWGLGFIEKNLYKYNDLTINSKFAFGFSNDGPQSYLRMSAKYELLKNLNINVGLDARYMNVNLPFYVNTNNINSSTALSLNYGIQYQF